MHTSEFWNLILYTRTNNIYIYITNNITSIFRNICNVLYVNINVQIYNATDTQPKDTVKNLLKIQ